MSVRIDINMHGLDAIQNGLETDVDGWMRTVMADAVADVKLSHGSSPPGRTYKRGSRTHIASVAGYPPNPDTGAFRASIRWVAEGRLAYALVDGVEYGVYLELGTPFMRARPSVRPVWKKLPDMAIDAAKRRGLIIRLVKR